MFSCEKGKNATAGYAAICQHGSAQMGHLKTTTVHVVIFKKQGWNVKNEVIYLKSFFS